MSAYLEITSFPIQRSIKAEDKISPVADLVARMVDSNETIELRIQKLKGKIHCYVGIESVNRAKQLVNILKQNNYGVAVNINLQTMITKTIMLRKMHDNYRLVPGENTERSVVLNEIFTEKTQIEALFNAINSMCDNCGYSVFVRKKDKFAEIVTTTYLKTEMVEESIESKLFHASVLFECCLCIYGDNENDIELVESELQCAFGQIQKITVPEMPVHAQQIWETIKKVNYPITVRGTKELLFTYLFSEVQQFLSLDKLYKVNNISINKDSLFPKQKIYENKNMQSICLGVGEDGTEQRIPLKMLRQHMFIAGAPGTGKGNLIFSLAEQLHAYNIPILLIESAKQEQHHLRKKLPELRVWRPIGGEYILNPFSLPPDITMGEYRSALLQMLRVCFKAEGGPLEELYASTLSRCLAKYGYTENSKMDSPGTIPFGVSEFIEEYCQLLINNGYSDKTFLDMRTAGVTRLRTLFDQNPDVFDTVNSIPVSELTHGENLVQLNSLTTMESKQLFATILLISLAAWLRLNGKASDGLQLVVIMDESHNLLKGVENHDGTKYTFSEDFQNLLLEMRSIGVGFIVADQSADNLPHMISEVCATKVFLGASRFSGIEEYANLLRADEDTLSHLYLLNPGEGVWIRYGMSGGAYFKSDNVIENYHVNEHYLRRNTYLETHAAFVCQTFSECKSCKSRDNCSIQSKENARRVSSLLINQYKGKLSSLLIKYDKAYSLYDEMATKVTNALLNDKRKELKDFIEMRLKSIGKNGVMDYVHIKDYIINNMNQCVKWLTSQETEKVIEYIQQRDKMVAILYDIAKDLYTKSGEVDINCCMVQFVRTFNREAEYAIPTVWVNCIFNDIKQLKKKNAT